MKNKMIKMSTRVISAMLVATTVFTTVAPTVYAAEPTAIAEEATIVYEAPVVEETPAVPEDEAPVVENSNEGVICDYDGSVSEGTGIDTQSATETVEEDRGDIIDDEFVEIEGRGDVIDDEFAVAPSEVSEQMNSDTSEETQVGTNSVFCTSERLDEIAAMEISDPAIRAMRDRAVEADRSLFCAGLLKRYYLQKGPNLTFILGIYYIPSPIVYEIVQVIEHEVENGNRSYIYNGQFYASPEEDPTFNEFLNR